MSILPDFPETKSTLTWLTPAERELALRRMAEDSIHEQRDEDFRLAFKSTSSRSRLSLPLKLGNRWPGLYLALIDPKVWWLALTLTVMVISLSFNAYFPTIVGTLTIGSGSNVKMVLLLCVPPWLWATVVAVLVNRFVVLFMYFYKNVLTVGRHSDKGGERCRYIMSSLFVGIVGFVLAMSTMNFAIRYFSL